MGRIIAYNSKSPNNGPYGQYMVGGLVQQTVYFYSQYMENKKIVQTTNQYGIPKHRAYQPLTIV